MEILNTIWQYVLPIGGGVTLGALIIGILVPVVKGTVSKLIDRINVEKIEEKAVNAGVEKIKTNNLLRPSSSRNSSRSWKLLTTNSTRNWTM